MPINGTQLALTDEVLGRPLCLLLVVVGCSRDLDSRGVAQALVKNTAGLILAVDQDSRCGFESNTAQIVVEGQVGELGSATWSIEDCVLDFAPERDNNCDPTARALVGQVRVSGTRTVLGTVTGNPLMPIRSDGPDATEIAISARLENFGGDGTTKDVGVVALPAARGSLEVKARLRRANGLGGGCTVVSPNVAIEGLNYRGELDVVDAIQTTVTVSSSNLSAVQGLVAEAENTMSGAMVVGSQEHAWTDIPLDEPYYGALFIEAAACQPGVALPVSYTCGAPSNAAATRLAAKTADIVALVARLARNNKECGFLGAGAEVQADGSTTAQELRRITGCRIDLGEATPIGGSCGQDQTIAAGAVTVTGTMHTEGHATQQTGVSVLPAHDGALSFELSSIVFEGFVTSRGNQRFSLNGEAQAVLSSRLARSTETGQCTIATPITQISELRFSDLNVSIEGAERQAQAMLSSGGLTATIGTWGVSENELAGAVSVADVSYDVSGPVDLNYNRTRFDESWQCDDVAPARPFVCDGNTVIAADIAHHSVLGFQAIAALVEADARCGFSSVEAKAAAVTSGDVGSANGQGIFTISGCNLNFATPTPVVTDCHGNQTWVEGSLQVSGTKTIDGWITGDSAEPFISTERQGVRYTLSADVDSLRIHTDDQSLNWSASGGAISGVYVPRVAINTDNGACTLLTPEAHVESLEISSEIEVPLGRRQVPASSLFGTIGRLSPEDQNEVRGRVSLAGQEILVRPQPLYPDFDAQRFEAGFACQDGMALAADNLDCDMKQVLAEVGARLLVQSMASVTQVAGRDDVGCAFGSRGTLTDPSEVVGELGEYGHLVWTASDCRLGFNNNEQGEPFNTSCEGDDQYFDGWATIDADRRMEGIRDETRGADYIHPETPNATRIDYRSVRFDNFSAYSYAPGEPGAEHQIWIHAGTMAGVVEPFMAKGDGSHDAFDEGDYTVPTPIARFDGLTATGIDATIHYDNKQFRVRINDAQLEAFSGSWENAVGETNRFSGSITIDGRTIRLARGGRLNPDYNQAEFDQSYACANRLLEPIPPE